MFYNTCAIFNNHKLFVNNGMAIPYFLCKPTALRGYSTGLPKRGGHVVRRVVKRVLRETVSFKGINFISKSFYK